VIVTDSSALCDRGRRQLRKSVSFYDGLYVALAETAGLPLVTADVKLRGAAGPRWTFELV
jgi:predicted nucleic acid-binding protein